MDLRRWLRTNLVERGRIREAMARYRLARVLIERKDVPSYLQRLVHHAAHHVPYYRERIDLERFQREGLSAIPILTKADVRDHFETLCSEDAVLRKAYSTHTSGSTGKPLTVFLDPEFHSWLLATDYYLYYELLGLDPLASTSVVFYGTLNTSRQKASGALQRRFRLWLARCKFYNTCVITKEDVAHYVRVLSQMRPDRVHGYPGRLYWIARFAQEHGLEIPPVRCVTTISETVTAAKRRRIESFFGAPLHDTYGTRECGLIAAQCRYGRYHVFNFAVHVELLDAEGNPVEPGVEGRVLVTPLHNFSMPLLRYEVEDFASWAAGECPCGSPLPALEAIRGRYSDTFVRRDGAVVRGLTRLLEAQTTEEIQLVQTDFDEIRISYVPRSPAAAAEIEQLAKTLQGIMGSDCRILRQEVASIPPSPGGKHLHIISEVGRRLESSED